MNEEQYLLVALKQGNREAFSLLFRKYYKDLVLFGGNFLGDKVRSEDIVQTVFLKLWTDRENIEIETSLKSFLLRSVRNGCLDELRHRQVIREHESYTEIFGNVDHLDTEHYILFSDLQAHLNVALEKLPETCREAFEMNRVEGLKYKEIAQRLDVSERTVEVRIGKAIGLLRQYLKEFFVAILALLLS
ncbi:MAG: RNA polymerase sigma-70 factor [Bacteroidota bacterium]|nr:RNA polymerase sigma-70 factor [Bacteroidota bacterium]